MHVCIEAATLGSLQHLSITDGKFQWISEIPLGAWVLRHEACVTDPKCLKTLFALNGTELNTNIPDKYVMSMRETMDDRYNRDLVRWQYVLPKHAYSTFLSTLTQDVLLGLTKVDTTYHQQVFLKGNSVLSALLPMAVSMEKLEGYLGEESSDSNIANLESFRPTSGNLASPIVYDRFGTRTGRLTVSSGPQILTLKRERRDIIRSSYPDGQVFYVDFSSLEARTVLSVMSKRVETQDVYGEISSRFLQGKYPRNVVKLAVLALLYGLGMQNLRQMLGGTKKEAEAFIDSMKQHFGIEILRQQLLEQWKAGDGKIRNFYGRVVPVPDESTLINTYVQSTAADVALLGFGNIIDWIHSTGHRIRPLALLHDALFVDVAPECVSLMPEVCEVGSVIPQLQNTFFLDAKPLNTA